MPSPVALPLNVSVEAVSIGLESPEAALPSSAGWDGLDSLSMSWEPPLPYIEGLELDTDFELVL